LTGPQGFRDPSKRLFARARTLQDPRRLPDDLVPAEARDFAECGVCKDDPRPWLVKLTCRRDQDTVVRHLDQIKQSRFHDIIKYRPDWLLLVV